ncbi:MAG: 3-oxoacyl-ACP reductase FabG [Oscillospiraceae bacterium]|nr:3-oxoacyl-ACP reductase FabG [Oscillospiraceae bacterium]
MAKTALITGASRGIGAAVAEALCAKGWRTAVCYRQNRALAEELAQRLSAIGPGAAAVRLDVRDSESVRRAFHEAEALLGPVSGLVNNAGIAQCGLFTELAEDDWQALLDINLTGMYRTLKAALPGMIHRKEGAVVNIASMWGQTGGSCEAAYSASKGGVIALTKALAKELGPSGIRVNCVSPGVIDTDMMSPYTDADRAALADETPLCRIGTPEEAAAAVAFLLGDDASFITGQVLCPNGGILM